MRQVEVLTLSLADGEKPPDEIVVFADGRIPMGGADDVFLDRKDADAIIAKFEEQGVDIPIDWEHSSVVNADKGLQSPAAGWIQSLRYEKGRGLIARVKWTETASNQITKREYKYLSPVFLLDKKTRHIAHLHSVALTNKPRTKDIPALMAASVAFAGLLKEDEQMNKKLHKVANGLAKLVCAEEVLPDVVVDVEALPDEQVDQLTEVGAAIDALRQALGMDEGETAVEVINAATAKVGSAEDEPAEGDVAEGEAASAGGKTTVTTTKKTETMANSVPLAMYRDLENKVAEIYAELKTGKADDYVAELCKSGKVNPNSKESVLWAKDFATRDMTACSAHFKDAPTLWSQERVVKEDGVTPHNDRERIMASAGKEWENEPAKRQGNSKKSWINCVLDEESETKLTEDECKTMGVC